MDFSFSILSEALTSIDTLDVKKESTQGLGVVIDNTPSSLPQIQLGRSYKSRTFTANRDNGDVG